jgi:hypothetical protein
MEVSRVGVEAEVEMMTVDTHVVTEIALTRPAVEMETSIEVVDALAHALGVQTDTTAPVEGTAATAMK